MPVTPAAAERSSGSTTASTYDWRVGTSIWLRTKRASRTATASGSVGISGTRMSSTLDGRWVNTIVLMRPNRAAMRAADSDDTAASRFAAKKISPRTAGSDLEPRREPEGHERLRDEAAGEGVEGEQRRQPRDDPAGAAPRPRRSGCLPGDGRARRGFDGGPERPGDRRHRQTDRRVADDDGPVGGQVRPAAVDEGAAQDPGEERTGRRGHVARQRVPGERRGPATVRHDLGKRRPARPRGTGRPRCRSARSPR